MIDVTKYPSVQDALDAAAQTGEKAYFPPGEHEYTGTVPPSVSLVGAGRQSRINGHVTFTGNFGRSIQDLTFGGKVTVEGQRFCDWFRVRFEDQTEFVPNVRVPGQSAAFCHYNKFTSCWWRGKEGGTGIVDPIVSYGINNFNWFDGCTITPSADCTLGGVSILADSLGGTGPAGGWMMRGISIEANQNGAYKPFLNISGKQHSFTELWLEIRHVPELTWADAAGVRFNADSRHCTLDKTNLGTAFGKYPAQGIFNVQNLGRFNTIQDRRTDRDLWDTQGITGEVNWVTQSAFETAGGTVPPEPDHYGG